MNRLYFKTLSIAGAIFAAASVSAADGVWNPAKIGASFSWSDTANWTGGVIPGNGGTATIVVSGSAKTTIHDSTADVTLGALTYSNKTNSAELRLKSLTFTAPALVTAEPTTTELYLQLNPSSLICSERLTFTGQNRVDLGVSSGALAGGVLLSNAFVRVNNTTFAPVPATLVPDWVIIDGATFENTGKVTLPANIGLTVTANNAWLGASGADSFFKINGPITGPGVVYIDFQASPVIFTNPANDWTGGMTIGGTGRGYGTGRQAWFRLGADEVIPHGAGKGGLTMKNNPGANTLFAGPWFDLAGHTETVNSLTAASRSRLISTDGPGCLIVLGNSSYAGSISQDATLKMATAGTTLNLAGASVTGTVESVGGAVTASAATAFAAGSVLRLKGASYTMASGNADVLLQCALEVEGSSTLSVTGTTGKVYLTGGVTLANGATLTVTTPGSAPLYLMGLWDSPVTLPADISSIVSPGGIVLTGFFRYSGALPSGVTSSPDCVFVFDHDNAQSGTLTGCGSLYALNPTAFGGATTVGAGTTLTLDPLAESCWFDGLGTVRARYVRFLPLASWPWEAGGHSITKSNLWNHTGISMSEFALAKDGVALPNPVGTTATAAYPSSLTSTERAEKTVDGTRETKWYASVQKPATGLPDGLLIDYGQTMEFNAYRWATSNDSPGRDPYTWKVKAGIDYGGTVVWTYIDEQTECIVGEARKTWSTYFPAVDSRTQTGVAATLAVANGGTLRASGAPRVRYVRLTIRKGTGGEVASGYAKNVQLSEIELYRDGVKVAWPAGTVCTSKSYSGNEGPDKLIDGKVALGSKCYWSGMSAPVVIEMPVPVVFDEYRWYTANDSAPTRDPVSWTLSVSFDGLTWKAVDKVDDYPTTSTRLVEAYRKTIAGAPTGFTDMITDATPLDVAAGGTFELANLVETVGGLTGGGAVMLQSQAKLGVTVAEGASVTFGGSVTGGTSTFVKKGAGEQRLTGDVSVGTIIVEDGVLNLARAHVAAGVQIIVNGGRVVRRGLEISFR